MSGRVVVRLAAPWARKAADLNQTAEAVAEYEFIEKLKEDDLCRDFITGDQLTREVLEHIRPDWTGLSAKRLKALNDFTGGDLLLLDEVLQTIAEPYEIDGLTASTLLKSIRRQYGKIKRPADSWAEERQQVSALRFLMEVARTEEFPAAEAQKLLDILQEPWPKTN